MQNLKQHKRVLIISMDTIGEILAASPSAKALKQSNENTDITWLTRTDFAPLLETNPYIDHVICWDPPSATFKNWKGLLSAAFQLRKKLAPLSFDLALDLQGAFTSSLATWLSRAPHRIGLTDNEDSNGFLTKTISRTLGDRVHMGSEYRYLITQLGASDRDWSIFVPSSNMIRASSNTLLKECTKNEAYMVITPFSDHKEKRWNLNNWQQVALRVRGRYKLKTVILGLKHEADKAERIARACGAINLAGKTNILEAAEIIRKAEFVIGTDNGLTHMAHALNIPTLAIFGPTLPYAYTNHSHSQILTPNIACAPCNNNPTCKGAFHCMQEITPDRVLTEIKSIAHNSTTMARNTINI